MRRNKRVKLKILTEKQLDKVVFCSCGNTDKYRNMFFYIDESNVAITNNSKPVCIECKKQITKWS